MKKLMKKDPELYQLTMTQLYGGYPKQRKTKSGLKYWHWHHLIDGEEVFESFPFLSWQTCLDENKKEIE